MWWDGEDVFLWSGESPVITLNECVHNLYGGVTVVRMIVVMEEPGWAIATKLHLT